MREPVRTVVADPPWPYGDRLPGGGRGAAKHYQLMSLDEICCYLPALLEDEGARVLQLAGGAHLYLWTTNAFIDRAFNVARAWGFEPKTVLTWVKVTNDSVVPFRCRSTGSVKVRMGMGRGYHNCTEQVVVATRGRLPMRLKDQPNVFFAPRGKHSQKPQIFYDIVEDMSPEPRLELFARERRKGWTQYGDELP